MKAVLRTMLAVITLAASVTFIPSCSRFGKSNAQSTEFAAFIKAHTGGIISDKSTIRVELATSVPEATPGADVKEGILSFTPSVKGTTRWLTDNTLEFIPETGALKPGQAYTGKLRLDRIHKMAGGKFKVFSFNFLVAIKEAVLSMDEMSITAASPEKANVSGSILLTEELPVETVRGMVEYSYFDESAELTVTAGPDPLHYHFDIVGLVRNEKDNPLKIKMKAGNTGFVADSKLEVTVPSTVGFRVISAERVEADDPYISVCFSNPIADVDDNSGLFTLEGAGRYYIQAGNSRVKVFYESPDDGPLTLKVSEAVSGYDGTTLGTPFTKTFSYAEDKPAVEIPLTGNILPNSKELILPFKAVNLNAVDISIIQIYEDNVLTFLQENGLDGESALRRSGRLVYKRCVRLDSDPSKNLHKWQDYSVDLSGLFKQEAGAIYRIRLSFKQEYSVYGKSETFKSGTPSNELVNISSVNISDEDDREWDRPYPYYYEDFYDWSKYEWEDRDNPLKPTYYMEDSRFPAINLMASNLGVIAKYSGGDKLWVSVSDIISAEPVFNSELYVYSYQLKEIGYAKTGTDGMAEISLSGRPFALVAKRSGAISYLKVTEGEEKSLSRFDVGGKVLDKGLKAFIYGERGVWRPGDTLHVTMILEDKDARIPDNHPAIMELYTPESRFYSKIVNSSAKNGFYLFDIPTRQEDPTGTWMAYFKVGGATFHKPLKIESIKPNRLKINLDLGDGPLEGGSTVPVGIQSSWLTGPPASGLAAKVGMTLRRGSQTFKGYEGYTFAAPMSEFSKSEHELVDTRLDRDGRATVNVTLPAAEDAPGMLTADLVTTVQEQGGDISFNTLSVPYSPYSSYVGVRVPREGDSHTLETDKDYRIDVAVVDKDGTAVAGDNLSYVVYKLKWSWWWESRQESLDSYVNGCSIQFRVDYPEWGRYLVLVKDNTSGHLSGEIFYVDWPAYRGRSSKSDPDALTMLSFSTDKESYEVGEKVKVFIPAAARGQALVSLENSRTVISREWVKTSGEGDVTYTFKVTPEMAPNFYIHISLIQPHERSDNDLPIRLYGVRPVQVNDKDSHLSPEIFMPDVLRPEEEFKVKVSEKNGKPMTYTLAIVDEGLLDLTGFKTPDPWKAMYEREALGVRTWDLYDYVIGAYSGRFSPMFSIGGDEDVRVGAKKDNRFNPVVKFLGPFTLQNGSATHKVKLPMYVGSVRVMLVAANGSVYGNAEKTVPVRSPLMVLPTLPRVIGSGEKVTLPVNVFALEDAVKSANVKVSVEGPLKVTGETAAAVKFEEPGDRLVKFNLEAVGEGTAKVTVTAEGSGHKASEVIEIAVRNPAPPTVEVTRAVIGKGEKKHFGWSPFEEGDGQWASLELASFPAMDFEALFTFLKDYSYNCSEQISSRGIGLLSIRDFLPEAKKQEADRLIPELLQQLSMRQLGNGGFSYWPGSVTDADNWVSSMAGWFMILASQNGFSVSKGVLASWARYQKRTVQDYRNNDGKGLRDLEQAFRLYTLALKGEPENGAMNRLRESQTLSAQAGWVLASAYAAAGKKNVAKEIIEGLKTDFQDYDEPGRTYGSPIRDKALAMEALILTDGLPEAMDVAQEIAKYMSAHWYSTQEAAFSAKAMGDLAGKANTGALNCEVSQGTNVMNVNSAKSVRNVSLATGEGGADVKNDSEGSVYATLTVSSVPRAGARTEPKASGLSLSVGYISSDGKALNPADIPQGTEFTASVTVGNTSGIRDYTNLALTEVVPSGWEIFNERLFGSEGSSPAYDHMDIRDDRVVWHFNLPKGTSRTFRIKMRAAYEGVFVLPAIKCEALYDSRVSVNNASGTATVSN